MGVQTRLAVLFLIFCNQICPAQNINFDRQEISFYQYPLKPLDKAVKTYSVSLQELGSNLDHDQHDTLLARLTLPGYRRVEAGGDAQLELLLSPLTITNKEIRDDPIESEKDGKKSVLHQYWYVIRYSFAAKIIVRVSGQVVNEQDLPGLYSADYYPQDRTSEVNLQREFDRDNYFIGKLKAIRIEGIQMEVRNWLASQHGYGFSNELIEIGYVKDKKGAYQDISQALALMHGAFASAHRDKEYRTEEFTSKIKEAMAIYEKALMESSDDKKARIDSKVTAMIQYNLAMANFGLNNLDEAEETARQIQNAGNAIASKAHTLISTIQDRRMRFVANGIIKSKSPEISELTVSPSPANDVHNFRNYIVYKPGDTLEVQFIMPSQEVMPFGDSLWLQEQIIVTKNEARIQYLPTQLHGYSYQGVFRESLEFVKDGPAIPMIIERKFCKRLTHGTISVYECYSVVNSVRDPTRQVVVPSSWYKKENEPILEVMFLNFNKGVSKLVSDYPELAERVRNGYYKRQEFTKVMQEYNQWKKDKM